MKFRSDRYTFCEEQHRESEKPNSQNEEARRSQKTHNRTASQLERKAKPVPPDDLYSANTLSVKAH